MKKALVFIIAAFFSVNIASAQKGGSGSAADNTFGAGLVLGYPTGLNAKWNVSNKIDLQFMGGFYIDNVGGAYNAYKNHYTRRKDYPYDYYNVNRIGTLQVDVHYHQVIPKLPELLWYAGGGLQVNFVNYHGNGYYNNNGYYYNDTFTEANVGLNANGGAEYSFKKLTGVNFSAFVQLGLYLELAQDPGLAFVTPCTGVRYWFK